LVKSRGAKRSVGLMMSALPHRMNCLPASTVKRPARERRGQAADGGAWPPGAAVVEIEAPSLVDLVVRVGSQIECAPKLHPRHRLEKHLLAEQQVADGTSRIVGRLLRKQEPAAFDETAPGQRLRRRLCAPQHSNAVISRGQEGREAHEGDSAPPREGRSPHGNDASPQTAE